MPAKPSKNDIDLEINDICPNYVEFDRRARKESKERISEHLAFRKKKIAHCIDMVMEDMQALPLSFAQNILFVDDGDILSVAKQQIERRINEWKGVQLKQCSKGVKIETFEPFVKKAKNHQDQTSWRISGDYFFAPYINKAKKFLDQYCDSVTGIAEQERQELCALCCLSFAAALFCTRIKFRRTKPKPLMRYRTLVKSDGIHTALEALHPKLAVRAMIQKAKAKRKREDNKTNIIVDQFCGKLEQFVYEQYVKQKERVCAYYKVAFDRKAMSPVASDVNARCAKDDEDDELDEATESEVDVTSSVQNAEANDRSRESDPLKQCQKSQNEDSDQVSVKSAYTDSSGDRCKPKKRVFQSVDVHKNKRDRESGSQWRQKQLRSSKVDRLCMQTSSMVECNDMCSASYCNVDRSRNAALSLPNLQLQSQSANGNANPCANPNICVDERTIVSSASALTSRPRLSIGAPVLYPNPHYAPVHYEEEHNTVTMMSRKISDLECQNEQLSAKVRRLERELQEQYIHGRRLYLHLQSTQRDYAAAYATPRPIHTQLPPPPWYAAHCRECTLPPMVTPPIDSRRHVSLYADRPPPTPLPFQADSHPHALLNDQLPAETYRPVYTRQQVICAPSTTTAAHISRLQPPVLQANQSWRNLSPNMTVLHGRDWREMSHAAQPGPFVFNGNGSASSAVRPTAMLLNSVFTT